MGNGNARGKKIAPASKTDAEGPTVDNAAQVDGRVHSVQRVRPLQKCTGSSLGHKNMAPDNQSESHCSDSSTDLECELDEILAESDGQERCARKNTGSKKHFFASKKFGLCNYIKGRNEDDEISTRQTPQGAETRSGLCHRAQSQMSAEEIRVCNKPRGKVTCANVSQKGWTATVSPETQHQDVPPRGQGDGDGPSSDKSAILYDATEEDLMKTIEREFS